MYHFSTLLTVFYASLLLGFFFLRHNSSNLGLGRLIFEVSRSHTFRHTTLHRTHLEEGSARRRGRYLHNTQHYCS
jgi:hypothetical protein